jgi:hypothetical protein
MLPVKCGADRFLAMKKSQEEAAVEKMKNGMAVRAY